MPTKATQIISTVLPHYPSISSMQKAKRFAAEKHIVTSSPKGHSPSLSVFGSEKMGAGFVTMSLLPMSLQYQTGHCIQVFSALNISSKMFCPVSHIHQDLNPFTELLRFLPLLLVPEIKIYRDLHLNRVT